MRRVGSTVSEAVNMVSRASIIVTYSRLKGVNRMGRDIGSRALDSATPFIIGNCACESFNDGTGCSCTMFIRNASRCTRGCTRLLSISFTDVGRCCSRGCSHSGFVGGIVLSGVLPNSVCLGTERLRFGDRISHIYLLVGVISGASISTCSVIRGLFPSGSGSFIVGVGRIRVTLIGRVGPSARDHSLRGLTDSVSSALSDRFCARYIINVNAAIANVGSLTEDFGRTRSTLRITGMFSASHAVMDCSGLNVTHLVCRLPAALYRVFLGRIFGHNSVRDLSRRALFAVRHFFRGGLGISRASEGLFMREGALICELRGVGGLANLSLHRFRSTVIFGMTLVIGGCLGTDPAGC